MNDLISRQRLLEYIHGDPVGRLLCDKYNLDGLIENLPPIQPEQLEQCPIYGGMCAYPSDQCYDCPRHAGARMEVTT